MYFLEFIHIAYFLHLLFGQEFGRVGVVYLFGTVTLTVAHLNGYEVVDADTVASLGTNMTGNLSQAMMQIVQQHPELAPLVQQAGQLMPNVAGAVNGMGQSVVDALHTDTRNAVAGAVLLTQPLYMGGKIRAYNQITHYAEEIAQEKLRGGRQEVILQVDQAYWQVVSLANKERLAISYRDMLQQLNKDG